MKKFSLAIVCAVAVLSLACPDVGAGEAAKPAGYPERTIHWISPTAAGAAVDLATRGFINFLDLGVSVVVENIAGGSQTIGATEAITRKADGYTLLSLATAGGITQPLMNEVGYQASDFRHIALMTPSIPSTICIRADSPLKTTRELLDLIARGDRYSYGVTNAGGYGHLAIVNTLLQLGQFGKPNGTMVVYNGSANTIAAVLNGEVIFALIDSADAYPKVQNGECRVLTVLDNKPCHLFPEAELISDFGVENADTFVGPKWIAIRKDTPDDIVEWLKLKFVEAVETEGYQELLVRTGHGPMRPRTEEEVTEMINKSVRDYSVVMKAAGIID